MGEPMLPTQSSIPMVPGAQDTFGASQQVSSSRTLSSAGSDAQKMAIQIIQQATQGAQNPIQNRPQVILPQPRIAKPMPTDSQPIGQVQATTRAGQRRNDMQGLISSVGNIVKAGVNKQREKSEQGLMHNLAVIQAASSNPDDPHNKLILDQMMNDPKVVKSLQKALGYNPLSGEEAPPETKTLQKFGAQLKQKQQVQQQGQVLNGQPQGNGQGGAPQPGAAMNNLMSRMPNTQQINPVISMQAELIKAGILPKNDLGPKALMDYVTEVMKDETKREELKTRAEATNNQGLMRLYDTIVKADATLKRGAASDTSKEKIGAGHDAAYKYGADKRFAAAESKAMRTDSTFKNLKIASDAYDKDIQRTEEQLSTLLKQKSTGTKEKGADIDNSIMLKKQELDKYKSLKDTMTNMMKERLQVEPASGGVDNLLQQETPKEEDMQFGDYVFGNQQQ